MVTRHQAWRYRKILNAVPLPALVMDGDARVHDLNDAARAAFGVDEAATLRRRCGQVLRCVNSATVSEGCGYAPACAECVLRESVLQGVGGESVVRRRARAEIRQGETGRRLELLVTASPMPDHEQPLAVVFIEDAGDLARPRGIVPICAKCKRVRGGGDRWRSVEAYFEEHAGVVFSHGLCPPCAEDLG